MPPNKSQVLKPKAISALSIRPSVSPDDVEVQEKRFSLLEEELRSVKVDLAGLHAQISMLSAQKAELEVENARLAKALAEKESAEVARAATKSVVKPRELVSYADIANTVTPQSQVLGQKRPLSLEEVTRIQKGFGPQPRVEFCRLYFEGQRKNRLGLIRETFRFAGCDMRHIMDISFIGSAIMMVLVKEEFKRDVIGCLKSINVKFLEDFDELDAKWMARSLREKGNPEDEVSIKKIALEKFISRITSRRNLIGQKNGNTFGYYSRVIREAEASLKDCEAAAAQSVVTSKDELDDLPSIEAMMSVDPITEPSNGQRD